MNGQWPCALSTFTVSYNDCFVKGLKEVLTISASFLQLEGWRRPGGGGVSVHVPQTSNQSRPSELRCVYYPTGTSLMTTLLSPTISETSMYCCPGRKHQRLVKLQHKPFLLQPHQHGSGISAGYRPISLGMSQITLPKHTCFLSL